MHPDALYQLARLRNADDIAAARQARHARAAGGASPGVRPPAARSSVWGWVFPARNRRLWTSQG
jgi:hypothetical protein